MEKIYIIGVGLIGGSLAKDLRGQYPKARFFGVDTTPDHITDAIAIGLIDEEGSIEAMQEADLVVLSIPVDIATTVLPLSLIHI